MLSVIELYFSSSPLDYELSWKVASCDSFSWILFTFGNHTDTGCLLCSQCVVEQFSTNTAGAPAKCLVCVLRWWIAQRDQHRCVKYYWKVRFNIAAALSCCSETQMFQMSFKTTWNFQYHQHFPCENFLIEFRANLFPVFWWGSVNLTEEAGDPSVMNSGYYSLVWYHHYTIIILLWFFISGLLHI